MLVLGNYLVDPRKAICVNLGRRSTWGDAPAHVKGGDQSGQAPTWCPLLSGYHLYYPSKKNYCRGGSVIQVSGSSNSCFLVKTQGWETIPMLGDETPHFLRQVYAT